MADENLARQAPDRHEPSVRLGSSFIGSLLIAACVAACGGREPDAENVKRGEAAYELAVDAFKRNSMRESLAHVRRALQLDDESANAAYLGSLVMLVFCADDASSPDCRYDEAENYVRRSLVLNPELRDARNTLGVVLIHRGKAVEAIGVLEPLARDMLYQSPEKSWGNLGWAYLEAGRAGEAIIALKRSVAAQPLFCVGHYRLGLAFEKQHELEAARQAFTRAVGIEEGACARLQDAFLGRGRVAKALGDTTEARKDFEHCRELAPSTTAGRACVAALLAAQ